MHGLSGLVTLIGGKWTTYRSIIGGDQWDPASFTKLAQQYLRMKKTASGKIVLGKTGTVVAQHLAHAYVVMAERVVKD